MKYKIKVIKILPPLEGDKYERDETTYEQIIERASDDVEKKIALAVNELI